MKGSSSKRSIREAWIRRFSGLFGSPGRLDDYRAGKITFRELYDSSLRSAELMLAEAQSIDSHGFENE